MKFHERAGMPKINRKQMATIKIPLPCIAKQEAIAKIYDEQIETVNRLKEMKSFAEAYITNTVISLWQDENG